MSIPLVVGVLFAAASETAKGPAPTWTDKEVLIALGSTVAALIPVVLFVFRLTFGGMRAKLRKALAEIERLKIHPPIATPQDLANRDQQLAETTKHLEDARRLAEKLEVESKTLKTSLNTLQGDLTTHQSHLDGERRRIQKALSKDGQTWTEKVRYNAPDFRPLDPEDRRMPIISVLNLKGGVGKTTITANLAAALDGMGYRVLLLDLDLQGSLTALFLSDAEQAHLFATEHTLGDFLAASFEAESPNLPRDYARPILPGRKSALVPTNDALTYAEANLTIRWLLREGNRDPRFLLRKELHFRRVTNDYDIVLLDCPPLINVCCVNALAASDYLLVPVMPSKQATVRAPILLKRLKEIRANINPDLKVMGIVANRTHWSDLTADEQSRLALLRVQCKDVLGEEVPQFQRFIRQNAEFRTVEDEGRPMRPGDEMYPVFLELAQEVQSRLPAFCQPSVPTPTVAPAKVVLS
jgi:cellulose biosynthesis protein BcsQ